MGKLIEFHRPVPTMDQITGKSIGQQQSPETTSMPPSSTNTGTNSEQDMSARAVLEELLPHADEMSQVIVIVKDDVGNIGFLGNLSSFEESMALLERAKFLAYVMDSKQSKQPNTTTPPEGA